VLRAFAFGLSQWNLVELRGVFGFSRTGAALQQVLDTAIEWLIRKDVVGEGSLGIAVFRPTEIRKPAWAPLGWGA
jgi:hypothetical protein